MTNYEYFKHCFPNHCDIGCEGFFENHCVYDFFRTSHCGLTPQCEKHWGMENEGERNE